MAYQPLYATVSDNQGGRGHTLALRGRVDNVGLWINSIWGDVLNVDASLWEGKERAKRPDLRLIPKDQRKAALDNYERECEAGDKVVVEIRLHDNPKFEYRIGGITLTPEQVRAILKGQEKDFLGLLGVTAALAMIPDMKKCVDGEPGACKELRRKMDGIGEILTEGEREIEKRYGEGAQV